jgi:ATP-binding cassette subfamily C protein CydCD
MDVLAAGTIVTTRVSGRALEMVRNPTRSLLVGEVSSRSWPVRQVATVMSRSAGCEDPPEIEVSEPTAHLDLVTRRALTADLFAATHGQTTLLTTHDLTGLAEVDEVIVLDHGAVIQRGTHEELLRDGGLCRALCETAR